MSVYSLEIMMKPIFLLCFLATCFWNAYAQAKKEFVETDTVPVFEQGLNEHSFLRTRERAFYWNMLANRHDSISQKESISERLVSKDTIKKPYMRSNGEFKNDRLFDGTIDYYNSRDELIISKRIQNGEAQEGYFFQGEVVNLTDDKGRETGKWILPITPFWLGKFENSENLFEYVANIQTYDKGTKIDTGYFYNRLGQLKQSFVHSKEGFPLKRILYSESAKDSVVDYYVSDPKYKFVRSVSIHYSESNPDCIIKKESYAQQNVNFIYHYIDCELYSKTSVKEKHGYEEITFTETHTFPESEGPGKRKQEAIEYTETFDTPVSIPIPYTVEVGRFDASESHLIHGKISYYDSNNVFIESKKVIDGRIVE